MERKDRIDRLIEELGGRQRVARLLDVSVSAIKRRIVMRALTPQWYPVLFREGARLGVDVPMDLFGTSGTNHWPAEETRAA